LLDLRIPRMPAKMALRPEEQVRRVSRDVGAENRPVIQIEIPFLVQSAGRAVLPPIRVEAPWGSYRTDTRLLEIPISAGDQRVPFDVSWSLPDETISVGQTVPLYLEVSNIRDFVLPEDIQVASQSGALLEEVRGLGAVETRVVDGTTLYRYPAATYFFTPTLEGELVIPSGVVEAQGLRREASPVEITVASLPDAVSATGAVGDFEVSAFLDPLELPVGRTATLTVRVEGIGNLRFLQFPEVSGEGLVITETGTGTEDTPTELGYRGTRTARYRVTPRESGTQELVVGEFPHLDPSTGAVSVSNAIAFRLNSLASRNESEEGQPASASLELLSIEELQRLQPADLFRRLWLYLIAIPPILALVVIAVLRRRVSRFAALFGGAVLLFLAAGVEIPVGVLEDGIAAYQQGDFPEARSDFMTAVEERPENPGIHYNLAIASARAGRTGEAVYHLRESVRRAPQFATGWEALRAVERRAGLERQVEPFRFPHPDYFAVAVVVLVYATAGLQVLMWRTRRGIVAILLALFLGVLVLTGGALGYSLYTRSRNVAVISVTQAPLTKIPDAQAQTWLSLPAGTAVTPVARYRNFVLIRTGYGVEGWTRVPDIIARTLPEGPS
jgi:tetratricopeptide (TPR) repeat protein